MSSSLCFPPCLLRLYLRHSSFCSPSPGPLVYLGLLSLGRRGLATRWASPRKEVNYTVHDGPGLLLWRSHFTQWERCALSDSWNYPCISS